jgi:hypothetical protein
MWSGLVKLSETWVCFFAFSQNGFMLPPEPPVAMSPSPERRAVVKGAP